MIQQFTIYGSLTTLNPYINAERAHKHRGARIKKDQTSLVCWSAKAAKLKPFNGKRKVHVVIHWYAKDKRTDKDNVSFAKKFILDGLVWAGVLIDDGWNQIGHIIDLYSVDPSEPRIEVILTDDPMEVEIIHQKEGIHEI